MKIINYIIASMLIFSFINAGEKEKTSNKDKKTSSAIERGYQFGDIKDEEELSKEEMEKLGADEGNIIKILLLQLQEDKKQTKLLTEIKDILAEEFSPNPKEITLEDGTKCIVNKGDDERCNRMPMINEVKRIPAIREAYENPTMENIKKREMWYAWYTLQVKSDAYKKVQAIRELGSEYPLATRYEGTVDSKGWDSTVRDLHEHNLWKENNKNFEYKVFLGVNKALDMFSFTSLAILIRNNPDLNIKFVFNSQESYEHWKSQYKNISSSSNFKNVPVVIDSEIFITNKIETTPTMYLYDVKKDKDTNIHTGRIDELSTRKKVVSYMIQEGHIKSNQLDTREIFKTKGVDEKIENYFNNTLGVDYAK